MNDRDGNARVDALFDKLGPEAVRKHLKNEKFQPQDVPQLKRRLFWHDFAMVLPRLLPFALLLIGTGAAVVSCWKM